MGKFGAIYYMVGGVICILAGIILVIVQDYGYGIGAIVLGAISVYWYWRKLKKMKQSQPPAK